MQCPVTRLIVKCPESDECAWWVAKECAAVAIAKRLKTLSNQLLQKGDRK